MSRLSRVIGGFVVIAAISVISTGPTKSQSLGSPVHADMQAHFQARTAAYQNLTQFSFGVFSDIHMAEPNYHVMNRTQWQNLLRQWRNAGNIFGMIIGDLGYGHATDPANVLSGPSAVPDAPPVFYTMGNHELDGIGKRAWMEALYPGAVQPASWLSQPLLAPGNGDHVYFSFDVGPHTHFIVLDGNYMTYDTAARAWQMFGERQRAWLTADVAANPSKNLLVFVHEPIEQQVTGTTPDYTLNDKGTLIDLLRAHPKQAVIFSGHLHNHRGVTSWKGIHSVHVQTATPTGAGLPPTYGVNVAIDGERITITNAGVVTDFNQHPMNQTETVLGQQIIRVAEDGAPAGTARSDFMTVVGPENGVVPTLGPLMLKSPSTTWFARRFISEQLIKIQPGMRFSFDIFLSGVVGGADAVTVQPDWHMTDGRMPPKVVDQNNLQLSQRPRGGPYFMYNQDIANLHGLASDRWYHREFDLSALAGHYVDGLYLTAAAGRVNVGAIYVDHIKFSWPAPAAPNVLPSVTLTSPPPGATFTAPAAITLTAVASDADGSVSEVAYYAGSTLLGRSSTAPYSVAWSNVQVGTYLLTAVAKDNGGATTTSTTATVNVVLTPPPPLPSGASASFVRADVQTTGSWKGTYGSQGYTLANDGTSLPSYVTLQHVAGASWTWSSSTADARALQKIGGSDRLAATWYGDFDTRLNFTDALTHRMAVYVVDFDRQGRDQTIQIIDTSTSAVLDQRTISGFESGQYLVWDVKGSVTLRIRRTAGPNAVYSALFFDPGSAPSSASFVTSDVTTRGTWKGVYGAEGHDLANDGTSLPSYVSVNRVGAASWTWANSTSVVQALQKADTSGRIAAAWYGDFDTNLTFIDTFTHRVALYVLDYDNQGRSETIQILDTATSAVLDQRAVNGFANGQYLVWDVKGAITIRLRRTAGPNAVYSALFFGAN